MNAHLSLRFQVVGRLEELKRAEIERLRKVILRGRERAILFDSGVDVLYRGAHRHRLDRKAIHVELSVREASIEKILKTPIGSMWARVCNLSGARGNFNAPWLNSRWR